jgi:deoxycytidine triphosphate deaminase
MERLKRIRVEELSQSDGLITNPGPSLDEFAITIGDEIIVEGDGWSREDNKTVALAELPDACYWLQPGEFVLAVSRQLIHTPENVEGRFSLRTSLASWGYGYTMSGIIKPGFTGVLTLGITNYLRRRSLPLRAGEVIGSVDFYELYSEPDEQSPQDVLMSSPAQPVRPEIGIRTAAAGGSVSTASGILGNRARRR